MCDQKTAAVGEEAPTAARAAARATTTVDTEFAAWIKALFEDVLAPEQINTHTAVAYLRGGIRDLHSSLDLLQRRLGLANDTTEDAQPAPGVEGKTLLAGNLADVYNLLVDAIDRVVWLRGQA